MTTHQAADGQTGSPQETVFLQRGLGIFGTGRVKPAMPSENGTECVLIETNHRDSETGWPAGRP